jgi:1-deoxy-D-xylulose-5-phosphate reductoisomerase
MKKKIAILGSTGSIGTQTLDVIRDHRDCFEVVGLTTRQNISLLQAQMTEFNPRIIAVENPDAFPSSDIQQGIRLAKGKTEGLVEVATHPEVDTVVVATVGAAGLVPTLAALHAGKRIALANKEVLVMGGDILMAEAHRLNRPILPIDSEHSAILQCLQGENCTRIRRIVITASGGPFRKWSLEQISQATPQDALNHPTWSMGPKITIDSATLMNKGLEIIEAHHLFNLSVEQIDVVIHPQSIIHSMVEFADGAVMAQMGVPDMKIPIQFALTYPDRFPRNDLPLDLPSLGKLSFDQPDLTRFPCLGMAREACRLGGGYPAVLSVANEEAVSAFLKEEIPFGEISTRIRMELDDFRSPSRIDFDTLLEIEKHTRESFRKKTRGNGG